MVTDILLYPVDTLKTRIQAVGWKVKVRGAKPRMMTPYSGIDCIIAAAFPVNLAFFYGYEFINSQFSEYGITCRVNHTKKQRRKVGQSHHTSTSFPLLWLKPFRWQSKIRSRLSSRTCNLENSLTLEKPLALYGKRENCVASSRATARCYGERFHSQ